MSAKPYHAGHDALLRIAASQCDEVRLFVSLSDRKRTGEMVIRGDAMKQIWERFIIPTLPPNVKLNYAHIPVSNVYGELEYAEKSNDCENTFTIYSDPEDMEANFPNRRLVRNSPSLCERQQVILSGIERNETIPINGTQMRNFLRDENVDSFSAFLPATIRKHAGEIVEILKSPV